MELEYIRGMINSSDIKQKILIVKKEFYEEFKKEIDNLIKENWNLDLTITNMLDDKTNAVVMDKYKFYGID